MDKNREEIAFDLDNNRPVEGDILIVPRSLVFPVMNLRKNGYNVINCYYPDSRHIYLKDSEIEVVGKDRETVIKEGLEQGEYRRICKDSDGVIVYDSFAPRLEAYIDFSKDTKLPFIPEGAELVELEDRLRLKATFNLVKEEDFMGEEKIEMGNSSVSFSKWVEELIGKPLEDIDLNKEDKYGNSFYAFDPNTNEEIDCHYVFCDPLIIPAVMVLREKGYVTAGCCSGHFDNIFTQNTGLFPKEEVYTNHTWIVFNKEVPVPYDVEGKEVEEWESSPYVRVEIDNPTTKEDGLYKTSSEIKKEVEESNIKMYEWAKSLPLAKKHTLS